MLTKSVAKTKALSIRHTLDELHTFVDGLGAADEKARGQELVERMHKKLNGAAHQLAEVYDDTPETFSGGTDKPREN